MTPPQPTELWETKSGRECTRNKSGITTPGRGEKCSGMYMNAEFQIQGGRDPRSKCRQRKEQNEDENGQMTEKNGSQGSASEPDACWEGDEDGRSVGQIDPGCGSLSSSENGIYWLIKNE